jgi:GNAT superfamily N-acetyltransferase
MGLLSRGPTVSNEIFRKLTEADMDACLDLAVSRDWLPEAKKWQLLFDAGDVYGIQDNRDGIIATLASTIYPPGISAMSMMLVAKHREREGLGTKLMNYVIDATGDIPAFLAATPYGLPLYERIGFRATSVADVYMGYSNDVSPAEKSVVSPFNPDDLPSLGALDMDSLGLDRMLLLRRLPIF